MSKRTILVADTDVPLLQAIGVGLRSGGYEIVLAQNADQAADRARTHAPDLLLIDLGLRGSIDRIRAAAGSAPLVYMTAEPAERIDASVRREAQAVLHKPFEARTLLSTLGETLGTAVRATQRLG